LDLRRGALDGAARTIPYGGYVDFDGEPVNAGGVKFNFVLFPCATPGPGQCSHLWVARGAWNDAVPWTQGWPAAASGAVTLPIFSGRFTVELGAAGQNPLPDVIHDEGHEVLYLGIQIEGAGLGALQKITPAFRAITSARADRFRVRTAIDIDDPAAGGSVRRESDGGLVVSHSNGGLPADASLLRVEHGGQTRLGVSAGGVAVGGDVRATGKVCDENGCLENRKVLWHAYNSGSASFSGGATLKYGSTTVNVGSAYDPVTGIATIPIAGIYRLCTYTITPGSAGEVHIQLFVNQVSSEGGTVYGYDGTGTNHVNMAGCVMKQLGAGDTVEWRSTGSRTPYPSPIHSYMNGELL